VYLLDTNVISALAPWRLPPLPALVEWMERHSDDLFLSVITVAEIKMGIAKSRREKATRQASDLQAWLGAVVALYGNRVLALDTETARLVGSLSDFARGREKPPGLADIIVAATAERHKLTLLTRNVRHFTPLEVSAVDPFERLPP
jgi:toxin FitB